LTRAGETGTAYDLVIVDCRMPDLDGFAVARIAAKEFQLQIPLIMLLTFDEKRLSAKRYRDAGIDLCLTKPVKRAELFRAIASLVSGRPPEVTPAAAVSIIAAGDFPPASLLLVEDYGHNRTVIQQYLKEAPFRIDMAENGRVAVEKAKQTEYDLILMDIQMPLMDGLAATRTIWEYERLHNRGRAPIIALTAFGMGEDSDACLRAGCDLYLAKPVRKHDLLQALADHLPGRPKQAAGTAGSHKPAGEAGTETDSYPVLIDQAFADYVPLFLADVKEDIARMNGDLERRDFPAIARDAHSIKGAGGGYGLHYVSEIAKNIERAAKEENYKDTALQLDALLDYVTRVRPLLPPERGPEQGSPGGPEQAA
jgi:CheY-like chemotaxis protein/HPt (histidine-containing phosphotransfer) domain-containing protein